ncbi:MAG: imidazole glycerol phosphate synthase subunit HisH [bacterium]|nr:imidazole glycerol phosphate synthase subunit HisH [bacterium]
MIDSVKKEILIIDYKVGNHQSVENALSFLGYDFFVSDKKEDIQNAKVLILPGVGAFGEAMDNLKELGILETLSQEVLVKKKPILGICLGMQIMADYSEENGHHKGLGFIEGGFVKLEAKKGLRVPHVGWNTIKILKKSPLFSNAKEDVSFYFDHSYYFKGKKKYASAVCDYGFDVVAAFQKDHMFGVQFHPEKSQSNGLKLFRSFFDYLGVKKHA